MKICPAFVARALPLVCLLSAVLHGEEPKNVLAFTSAADGSHGYAAPPPPTAEHPTYYAAMAGGFHHEGWTVKGDHPEKVTVEQVWLPLQRALAAQHYLAAPKGITPSLLIVFHWGDLRLAADQEPRDFDSEDAKNEFDTEYDQKRALTLVGGSRVDGFGSDGDHAMSLAVEPRYFVVVNAYDYASAKQKKKKRYWTARLSAPTAGTSLAESIVPMIRTGAPFFGRDSGTAKEIEWDRAKVIVGDAVVTEEPPLPKAPAVPPEAKPANAGGK
jgi:hypothetical protein